MFNEDEIRQRAGTYLPEPAGYRAFVPASLPPNPAIVFDAALASLLSNADVQLGRLGDRRAKPLRPTVRRYRGSCAATWHRAPERSGGGEERRGRFFGLPRGRTRPPVEPQPAESNAGRAP